MDRKITMFDELELELVCGHRTTVGRLEHADTWTCDERGCGKTTDLRQEPYKTQLAQQLDTADQNDKQAREQGAIIVRFEDF
jgi:hypothetical protein